MEDTAILKRLPFLQGLDAIELSQINRVVSRASFGAGEEIVREGSPCDAFFVIREGAVKVFKEGTHLVDLGPGDPVGEISFIDQGTRSATVTATEDTVLLKIPSAPFAELMARNKDMAYKVYKSMAEILCRKLRETNEALKLIQT